MTVTFMTINQFESAKIMNINSNGKCNTYIILMKRYSSYLCNLILLISQSSFNVYFKFLNSQCITSTKYYFSGNPTFVLKFMCITILMRECGFKNRRYTEQDLPPCNVQFSIIDSDFFSMISMNQVTDGFFQCRIKVFEYVKYWNLEIYHL